MQATGFEYRHRYFIHGFIYALCFAAPWAPLLPPPYHAVAWSFMQNGSTWFVVTNDLSKPLYQHFSLYWDVVLLVMIVFAVAGAALRVCGAAYLGASTVHRGGMVSDRIVADGPYRFVRNPLYLGTILHTVALAFLMRPDAAVLAVALITLVQFRLIGREEPYLQERLGEAYTAYLSKVPRLLPSLRPRTAAGTDRPRWKQGILSETYMIATALTLLMVGWSRGFAWETSFLRVVQGLIVSLGLSVVARAFIPRATF